MRIAIAEKCGLPVDVCMCGDSKKGSHYGHTFTPMCSLDEVPNYPADLNAMHEAEKALDNEDQRDEYWCLLRHSVSAGLDDMQHCFNTAHATAAQRAEAFCRVFWPERFK